MATNKSNIGKSMKYKCGGKVHKKKYNKGGKVDRKELDAEMSARTSPMTTERMKKESKRLAQGAKNRETYKDREFNDYWDRKSGKKAKYGPGFNKGGKAAMECCAASYLHEKAKMYKGGK